MEALSEIGPVIWILLGAAAIICGLVLWSKVIKPALKLAVIFVMLLFMAYFLTQAGVIAFPRLD